MLCDMRDGAADMQLVATLIAQRAPTARSTFGKPPPTQTSGRASTYAGRIACCAPHTHATQLVLIVLGGWGVVIYGATKIFGGKKKEAEPAK